MTKTFYCDKETHILIEEARKLNPEFNLSSFIKKSLKNVSGEEKKLDLDFINKNIDNFQLDKQKIQSEIDYWKGLELKYHQLKNQELLREQNEREDLSLGDKIYSFIRNLSKDEELEYREGLNSKWKSYFEYAKFKILSNHTDSELQVAGGQPS